MWTFEFKMPFLCGNDGGRKFLRRTLRVSKKGIKQSALS
jgi:hypothetical protein